jgi:phosphoglycolate phosphatase
LPEPSVAHVRAVLFDLDGTLLDSLEDIGRSANETLEELGFPSHPIESYRQFIGDGLPMLFRRALPAGVDAAAVIDHCVGGFRESYGRSWNVASRPYPGIPELLDGLVTRSLGMAVLSNKPHTFTVQCVNELLPRWPFRVVLGDREGFPRKPDPGEALRIATQLDVAPEQMVYLGDSSIDMTTAHRAGMIPIGVAWGFRSVDELQASGAVRIITHPLELLRFLDHEGYSS